MSYIDTKKIIYNNTLGFSKDSDYITRYQIDKMKKENVKPIIYAKWLLESDEEMPNPMFKLCYCSNCKNKIATTNLSTDYKYCPYCGAEMAV